MNPDDCFPLCVICGHDVADCVCPECPVCGQHGDEACYEHHGLILSEVQKAGKQEAQQREQEEDAFWEAYGDSSNEP